MKIMFLFTSSCLYVFMSSCLRALLEFHALRLELFVDAVDVVVVAHGPVIIHPCRKVENVNRDFSLEGDPLLGSGRRQPVDLFRCFARELAAQQVGEVARTLETNAAVTERTARSGEQRVGRRVV